MGLGGEPGLAGEVVKGAVVGAGGGTQRGGCWRAGVGELGLAGDQQMLGEPGEEECLADSGPGDLVAEGGRDALDETVDAEPA